MQCEVEALKSEQLIEVIKCKGKKVNGSKRQAKVSKVNSKKQTKDLLVTSGAQKTENISTFTRDLVPPLEDIQPVVSYDSNITVEEYDIVTGIKGNDRKNKSDPAEVITMKATVEQKVQVTPERVETGAKGGTPSKSINPPIHFGNDTPSPPRPSSLAALNSTHRIMHSSLEDGKRTIFISGMAEAILSPLMHTTATKSFESLKSRCSHLNRTKVHKPYVKVRPVIASYSSYGQSLAKEINNLIQVEKMIRSMFRRRMLQKTETNIQAAKVSKEATQSITQRLESTQRDLHVIERYGSSFGAKMSNMLSLTWRRNRAW
ncbi:hypothetical protein ACOME3_009818 [Neoechinorhynchus agilis]